GVPGMLVDRLGVVALLEVALRKLHDEALDGVSAAAGTMPATALMALRRCILAAAECLGSGRGRSFVPLHAARPCETAERTPEASACVTLGESPGGARPLQT